MKDFENNAAQAQESVATDESNNSKKGKQQKENKIPVATDKAADVDVMTEVSTTPSPRQAFMYLGPNIPGGRLFSGSVIRGGAPKDLEHLQDVFEKLPEILSLFVEVAKVPKYKNELANQGTEAHRLYNVVSSEIKKGVLKDGI